MAQSWPQKRKAIIIAKYMEDSVVKSVDILLKDYSIRNLKKKLHENQTKNKHSRKHVCFKLHAWVTAFTVKNV